MSKSSNLWDTEDPLLKDLCGLHPSLDLDRFEEGVSVWEFWTPQIMRNDKTCISLIHVDYGKKEVAHLYIPVSKKGNPLYSQGKLTDLGGIRPGNQWHPAPDRVDDFYKHRTKYINVKKFLGARNTETVVVDEEEFGRTVGELEAGS